jgi:hypothetical protein
MVVLFSAVFGTLFARNHGWLGGNAPERTNWILILGVVFIWALSRMWWRNHKQRQQERNNNE